MSESSQTWNTMKSNLNRLRGVRAKRIENSCDSGTPDVYLRSLHGAAWVELKHLKEFPVRPTTPIRIPHFTDQQRLWLREEGLLGGNAWLFVQVGKSYFLFDWMAAQHVTNWTRIQWLAHATRWWEGKCDWQELVQLTTKR